jgi:signal transduction histidine kinase/ligand-binding sensor domain-containing protein
MKRPLPAYGKALALFVMLSCCVLPPVCHAQAQAEVRPPINLHHSSWTARDGAPALVQSMTQTTDGWLWLAAPTGLYRFDGVQFEQFAPANEPLLTRNLSLVNAFADGVLWIGYRTGGAARLQHGRIRNYGESDGLPRRAVWGLEQDGNGRMWAATPLGMYYLDKDRWLPAGSAWNLPAMTYKTLMRDRQGILWAQGDAGVYFLKPGAARFERADTDSGTGVLFNLANDSVVSWNAVHGRFHQVAGRPQDAQSGLWHQMGDPTSLLFDRGGGLWVGLQEGVEYRTEHGIFRSTPAQGMSGRYIGAVLEDKEGNIWVSTAGGIDRFGRRRLSRVEVPVMGSAILADDQGGAWIGGYHVSDGDGGEFKVTPLWPANRQGWSSMLTTFTRTGDGVLWGSIHRGLRRVQGSDQRDIAVPPEVTSPVMPRVLADHDGSLLVGLRRQGLYRYQPDAGSWTKIANPCDIALMDRADGAGLWLACFDGRVLHADGASWRSYGPADGLSIGLVMALYLHGQHVWAGGDTGLALRIGERFRLMRGANGETFDGISGIVELANGELWLNAAAGLFRISGAEVARFQQDPDYAVQYQRLDQLDGLEGMAPRMEPSPSLVPGTDGRLWVLRSSGVFRLDPAEQLPPAPALPVIIKSIGAPGAAAPPQPATRFVPGTSSLQIDYTLPALAMPERLRFRYRLNNGDWQEVGNRRSVYLSNLGAGDYRFQVAASDYNGHWPDGASTAQFTIVPAITETWWFRMLCTLTLLAAACLAYRWHVIRLRRQMATRLRERVNERERIARELHDTLLQSVQGLILHVHAATMALPAKDSTRQQLETALLQADHVVDEGRDRIRGLRGEDAGKANFPDAVLAAATRLRPRDAPPVQLSLVGTPRRLDPTMHEEALAIVTEAIANAYRHAGAGRIEVELQYGARELRCTVRDDGAGIAADVLRDGGRQHHWGMRGMTERASRINAKLVLRSGEGSGTEWQLLLPATLAYTR